MPALACLLVAALPWAAPVPPVPAGEPLAEITLTIRDPGRQELRGRARLHGLSGPLILSLSESYAFAALPPRLADPPSARTPDGRPLTLTPAGSHAWELDPAGSQAAEVDWTVVLDHRRQPGVAGRDEYEHPYLAGDHGLLVAGAVLLTPDDPDLPVHVRLDLPDGWDAHVPWPEPEPGLFTPGPAGRRDDLLAVGHWDLIQGRAGAMDYTLAFAPGQEALADLVRPTLPPILEAEVELFGGAVQDDYLFVFGRPDQPGGYGGSPKQASMTLFVSPDLPTDFAAQGVSHLIAHEFHHTWMKARCDPLPELRFVMEGFTDYYAHLVPWRLGLVDDAALVTTLEEQLARAEGALARFGGDLLAVGGPAFFEGGPAYQACYAGGLALALWTDLALRDLDEPRSLDELMRAFYEDRRWRDGTRPTLGDWMGLLAERLGEAASEPLRAALAQDGGPDWRALLARVGVDVARHQEPVRGGPRANLDGATVLALDPDGAGALAGLRPGDRILRLNGGQVSGAGDVYRLWDLPLGDRLELVVEREGQRLDLSAPPPQRVVYRLPADLPRRLGTAAG